MGSFACDTNEMKRKTKSAVKSKGERLGWMPRNEIISLPLRDVVGKGMIVHDSVCYISSGVRKMVN